jgi:hypothetical protein
MDAVALHRAGAPQYANDLDIVGTCKRSAAQRHAQDRGLVIGRI